MFRLKPLEKLTGPIWLADLQCVGCLAHDLFVWAVGFDLP